MTETVILNDTKYKEEFTIRPHTKRFAPFYEIDRVKYDNALKKADLLHIAKIKERFPHDEYRKVRRSIAFTHYYANTFFPAYRILVNEFVNDEWLALVDYHKKFHRDHIVHQPKVSWIANKLLHLTIGPPVKGKPAKLIDHIVDVLVNCDDGKNETGYLRDYAVKLSVPEKYFDARWVEKNHWRELWWYDVIDTSITLAAMFHDIGYPANYLNKIEKKLRSQYPVNTFSEEFIKDFCMRYQSRLLFFPFHNYQDINAASFPFDWQSRFAKLANNCFTDSHSIQGALTFLYLNDILRKFPVSKPQPVKQFIVDLSALMIIMHDLAGIYMDIESDDSQFPPFYKMKQVQYPQLQIKFHRDPMSFLLIMSDLLQDFGRSNAQFKQETDSQSAETYGEVRFNCTQKCKEVELKFNKQKDHLTITYYYNQPGEVNNQRYCFIPQNQIRYFNRPQGYIDYSYLLNQITLKADLLPI